jgi:serine phosphatase RsbU (regulator of sigma subunit)
MAVRTLPRIRLSLAKKFALFVAGQMVLFGVVLLLFAFFSERQYVREVTEKRYSAIAKSFALAMDNQIAQRNELGYDDVTAMVGKEDGVSAAYVLDMKNIYLSHSGAGLVGTKHPLYRIPSSGKISEKYYMAYNDRNQLIYVFTHPIGDEYVAAIEVPYAVVQKQILLFLLKFSSALLFVFGISIVVIYFMVRHLVAPIKELTRGVEIIGSGNLNHRIRSSTDDEIGLLTEQFNRMTIRIRKAQELRIAQERIKNELEIASDIQQKLVPSKPLAFAEYEIIPYYSPAKEIGGDYLDFFPLAGKRLGFVVADVSGKGIPAALVMSMLKTIFTTLANVSLSTKEMLVIANSQLKRSVKTGVFVPATYGILDRDTNVVELAMAGSERVIHFNSQKHNSRLLKTDGIPLGIEEEQGFKETLQNSFVSLEKGEGLFLYTDGLTDIRNSRDDLFGVEGITDFISRFDFSRIGAFSKELIEETKRFRGSPKQEDDLSFILLMRK